MPTIEIDPFTESFDADSMFEDAPAVKRKVSLNPQEAFVRTIKSVVPAFVGIVMIWFGLTTTGSYYESASRFGGFLADVWYGWQFGNLLAMIGVVLIYDAIKRSGYL